MSGKMTWLAVRFLGQLGSICNVQCKSTPVDPRIPRPVIPVHVNIFNLIKLSFLSCPMHLFIYLNEFGLDRCTQKGVVEHAYECSHVCHFLLPLISWQSRKVPVFTTAGQSPERARSAQGNYRQEVQGTQKGVVEHACDCSHFCHGTGCT
jgi:hypothetical protein